MKVVLHDLTSKVVFAQQMLVLKCWSEDSFLETEGCGFYASFVPKSFVDETLKQLCATFHKKTLYAAIVKVVQNLSKAFVSVDDCRQTSVFQVKGGGKNVVTVDG